MPGNGRHLDEDHHVTMATKPKNCIVMRSDADIVK